MIKATLVAFALAAVLVKVNCMVGDEHLQDEELIIGKLDFARLFQVKKISNIFQRCNMYEQELREMLSGVNRDSMSQARLFEKVAAVINNKTPSSHIALIDDMGACTDLYNKGYKGQLATDSSFAPSKFSAPSSIDESVVLSRIDFAGLATVVSTLSKSSVGPLEKEAKCYTIEEELREMLGNAAEGKTQESLFDGVLCIIDRHGIQANDALKIWADLSSCVVSQSDYSTVADCWA